MRFVGNIGFSEMVEDPNKPGVWINRSIEKKYYGNIIHNKFKNKEQNKLIDFTISIIGDKYICNNFLYAKYIIVNNNKWIISNIEIIDKKINITTGDLYIENEN